MNAAVWRRARKAKYDGNCSESPYLGHLPRFVATDSAPSYEAGHTPAGRSQPQTAGRRVGGRRSFYIVATAPPVDEQSRVLKHGETFAVFDQFGDVRSVGTHEEGIYHEGTRFVSGWTLRLCADRPLILSSNVKRDNALLTVDLTNLDISAEAGVIPRGTVHLVRSKFLWQNCCYERLRLRNHGLTSVKLTFSLQFRADFADIFEVRGTRRTRRGEVLPPVVERDTLVLGYHGLDGVTRRTQIQFAPQPHALTADEAQFELSLRPQEEETFFVTAAFQTGATGSSPLSYDHAAAQASVRLKEARAQPSDIYTSNEQFNDWINRSFSDLHLMMTDMPGGPYPYAGVPWFSTAFGRDGIITALECLWVDPTIARGVLNFLAATQATELIPERDAEPGKILHETRGGEMAALGEIPFGRYYGSVDATPLFVLLAGAYYERTGDRTLIENIWPNLERALRWIDTLRRSGWRRLCGILPAFAERVGATGLERLTRFRLPQRCNARGWANRTVRGAGLCLRRQARSRESGDAAEPCRPGFPTPIAS